MDSALNTYGISDTPHTQSLNGSRNVPCKHNPHDTFTLDVNMPSTRASGLNRLLAEVRKKTIRSRILTALFGEQHDIVIIMPSRNIKNVSFKRDSVDDKAGFSYCNIASSEETEVASHEK